MTTPDLRDQLRRYAAVMEPSSEGAPTPRAARGWRPAAPVVAGLVAAAVLVVAAAVMRAPGGDQVVTGETMGPETAQEVLRASLTPLHLPGPPEGLGVTAVGELPAGGASRRSDADFQLFGARGAPDPFERGDLALFVNEDDGTDVVRTVISGGAPDQPSSGEEVALGAFSGLLVEDDPSLGGATLTWVQDGSVVRLVSRSLGTDALVEAARAGVEVSDEGPRLRQPPGDLELVASGRQAHAALLGFIVPLASTGFVVDYAATGGGPHHGVSVFAVADDGDLLDLVRWRDRDWLRSTEVRGRTALLVDRDEGGEQQLVAWTEEAGTIGMLSATGMSGDELLALAQEVRPASEQEWEGLEDHRR